MRNIVAFGKLGEKTTFSLLCNYTFLKNNSMYFCYLTITVIFQTKWILWSKNPVAAFFQVELTLVCVLVQTRKWEAEGTCLLQLKQGHYGLACSYANVSSQRERTVMAVHWPGIWQVNFTLNFPIQGEIGEPGQKGSKGDKGENVSFLLCPNVALFT